MVVENRQTLAWGVNNEDQKRRLISRELQNEVDEFLEKLTYSADAMGGGSGDHRAPLEVAVDTVDLLKKVVVRSDWRSPEELLAMLRSEGRILESPRAGVHDIVLGNLVRRVIRLIREDCQADGGRAHGREAVGCLEQQQDGGRHHHRRHLSARGGEDDAGGDNPAEEAPEAENQAPKDLKDRIVQSIDELAMELETSGDEIADQALEHIHASEVILTIGRSRTVELFLKRAARRGRTFQVIVAEGAPFYKGHELAASLARAKVPTTLITDSAVFGMMARVNKVIVGTHAILANGGLQAEAGLYTAALAAKFYSVPVMVTAPMHKLTHKFFNVSQQEAFGRLVSPQTLLNSGDGVEGNRVANGRMASNLHTFCPLFEYVPPDLVSLFISNTSGYSPSYVYRLLSELYHPEDYEL